MSAIIKSEYSINDIKQLQKRAAEAKSRAWWFGPGETKFFDSRVESGVYANPAVGTKQYFVTSEQCHFGDGTSAPRLYSVRWWDPTEPERIQTWGKFQQFRTKDAAVDAAKHLGIYGSLRFINTEDDE